MPVISAFAWQNLVVQVPAILSAAVMGLFTDTVRHNFGVSISMSIFFSAFIAGTTLDKAKYLGTET